jgi:hypothetical protein
VKPSVPASFAIPPELRAPPPRAVLRREGKGRGPVAARLFLLPHMLVGIGALLFVIGEPVLLLFTPAMPAVVTKLSTHTGSKGRITYRMDFDYSPTLTGGWAAHDQETITREEYESLHGGDRVMVHAAQVGRFRYVTLSRSFGNYARNRFFIWIWAIFWNGFMSFVVYPMWVRPIRYGQLVRIGRPVPGKITSRYVTRNKSTTYHVKYEFTTSDISREQRQGEMTITRAQYDAITDGGVVTVLYDPDRPAHHVVYECSGFKAETI